MTTIRTATVEDAAALAEVQFAAWRETYGDMLPRSVLDRVSPPIRAERWRRMLSDATPSNRQASRIYLAEQDGWTVGFVHGGRCRDSQLGQRMPAPETQAPQTQAPEMPAPEGPAPQTLTGPMEIYEIYLLDAVKRQGIGGRLLRTIFADFVASGAVSAGVWVLGDNHSARAFYESVGAEAVAEKIERVGGFDVHEVGYVWHDLRRALPR